MGGRGNIELVYGHYDPKQGNKQSIFLYTHWGGTELPTTLAAALKRGRDRWDDPSCLARIIFSEMIQGHVLSETGFGIDIFPAEDREHDILVVDLQHQKVHFEDSSKQYTYQEFIDAAPELLEDNEKDEEDEDNEDLS